MLETLEIPDLLQRSIGLVRVTVRTPNARAVIGMQEYPGAFPLHFRDHLVDVAQIFRWPAGMEHSGSILIRTVRADSEARFSLGEEAIVFLASAEMPAFQFTTRDQSPDLKAAAVFRVFGGFQGKFTIDRSEGVPTLLQPGSRPSLYSNLTSQIEQASRSVEESEDTGRQEWEFATEEVTAGEDDAEQQLKRRDLRLPRNRTTTA
jgi:hypothetical protein